MADPSDEDLSPRQCAHCRVVKYSFEFMSLRNRQALTKQCFSCRGAKVPTQVEQWRRNLLGESGQHLSHDKHTFHDHETSESSVETPPIPLRQILPRPPVTLPTPAQTVIRSRLKGTVLNNPVFNPLQTTGSSHSIMFPDNFMPNPLVIRPHPFHWFKCSLCNISRDVSDSSLRDGVCCYCVEDTLGINLATEMKWCFHGNHKMKRLDFFSGNTENDACNSCSPSLAPQVIHAPIIGHDTRDPEAPVMSHQDWQRIQSFHEAEEALAMEKCNRCNEKWFDLALNTARVCSKCVNQDRKFEDHGPFLFSAENRMDPGQLPNHLPALSDIEEMLVSRAHVHFEVHTVRGGLYGYTGHSINLLKNAGKLFSVIPLLPEDLDIILIRPNNYSSSPLLSDQFRPAFSVRRANVKLWVRHLKFNHPGYHDISISDEALDMLPEDGNVMNRVKISEIDSIEIDPTYQHTPIPPEMSAFPSAAVLQEELDIVGPSTIPGGKSPSYRLIRMQEFNTRYAFLSLAFPTLFPLGLGEFNLPRLRSVSYAQYIEHLMKYKDGRFARHHRFRSVVFNQIMRYQAEKSSLYMASKSSDIDSFETVADNPATANQLLNSVLYHASRLRGTSSFWKAKKRELDTYINNLGIPKLFLTFTYADLHWWSLARHMPNFHKWQTSLPAQKLKIARENLYANPAIATFIFHRRFGLFMKHCILPKFCPGEDNPDYWNRYEWQHRGSVHNHGLIWAVDTPKPPDEVDIASMAAYAGYWDPHISAVLPDVETGDLNPLSIAPQHKRNTVEMLCMILRRVQLHTCSHLYCFRTGQGTCRFYFPRDLSRTSILNRLLNPRYLMYQPSRNNGILNNYNPMITIGWSANTDISPCTGMQSLKSHLAKYVSRPEIKSPSLNSFIDNISSCVETNNPVASLAAKMMTELVDQRDWSAQEVSHILLNLPLCLGTRIVYTVDCRIEAPKTDRSRGLTPFQRYTQRTALTQDLNNLTYFEFLRDFNWQTLRTRTRSQPRLLEYFPRYKLGGSSHEEYCRMKMILHHPFKESIVEVLALHGHVCATYTEAFEKCNQICIQHPMDGLDDFEGYTLLESCPSEEANKKIINPSPFGLRPLDISANWSRFVNNFPHLTDSWWRIMKRDYPVNLEVRSSFAPIDKLNSSQRVIYNLFIDHYTETIKGSHPSQLLINVDGEAGTGKTFVVLAISTKLQILSSENQITAPVIRAAPTGVAAHGIMGRTLHALFRLPLRPSNEYESLSPLNLEALQLEMKGILYLLIDEKSMISLRMLGWIDRRCRDIWPSQRHVPFGGLNIAIFGDFWQLPPVAALSLFYDGPTYQLEQEGQVMYRIFDRNYELASVLRQEAAHFRTVLRNLRNSQVSRNDWSLLSSRVQGGLNITEISHFDNSVRLYARNSDVDEYNQKMMDSSNHPVLTLKAQNHPVRAKSAGQEDIGLANSIQLIIGARVMLDINLWTERGLVNGSLGTVRGFVWSKSTSLDQPPLAVLVEFDNYNGPVLEEQGFVPIFAITAEFTYKQSTCRRTQFPLTVAYAITIHKAQGLTLSSAVLNISRGDHTPGLTYVGISRLKTLESLMFEESFDFSRFIDRPSTMQAARQKDWARRYSIDC